MDTNGRSGGEGSVAYEVREISVLLGNHFANGILIRCI